MQKAILLLGLFVALVLGQTCVITVPPNPLSATGLATPYVVSGCNQVTAPTFVQGAIIDLTTGQISIYNPLVINQGTNPAIAPTPPTLPAKYVAALWFGTNGGATQLQADTGTGLSLQQGNCVNGSPTSIFGQFAYCNAPAFFAAANAAIAAGQLVVPPLGMASDGMPCPTTRDFFVVDQDQSDNVVTTYLVKNNLIAQNTAANRATLGATATVETNGSDERLLSVAMDGALGCTPWKAPDLADAGNMVPALPLNELLAAYRQQTPIALVPEGDPMCLEAGGIINDAKVNLYRAGVNQLPISASQTADTIGYCRQLIAVAIPRLNANFKALNASASADPAAANNLFTFLAQRLSTTLGPNGLNCLALLGLQTNPVSLTLTGGIATAAVLTPPTPPNPDCKLILPPNVLTAAGLATPFQLTALNPANGPCHQANPNQAAFVQGAILDLDTGAISAYNPLIVDVGATPAVAPKAPNLPANFVAALWFGTNGGTLTLGAADPNTLTQAACINGALDNPASIFGQFSYCNAVEFFSQANRLIRAGKIIVPPLGIAVDGQPCPTTRDFFVVDQDPSDNVITTYLVTPAGTLAQNTAANRAQLGATTVETNGSDNRLLAIAIDGALGCTPWKVPDLADPGAFVPTVPTNELLAAAWQAAPVAMLPANDPMTLDGNGNPNVVKSISYRLGVNQPPIGSIFDPTTEINQWCRNIISVFPVRLAINQAALQAGGSPDPVNANNLFSFLAMRFLGTIGPNNLNCVGRLNITADSIMTLQQDNLGRTIGATIKVAIPAPAGPANNNNGQLSNTAIIAIAVSVGGGALLIIAGVIIAVVLYRKMKRRNY